MLGNGTGEKVASLCLVSSQVAGKEETHTPAQSNQGKFPFIEHLPFSRHGQGRRSLWRLKSL